MKKILANKVYSDSTLKKWTKEDLIEQIRILEHNWSCAEESLANSVKNADKIFYEHKAEIERLTKERNKYIIELEDVESANDYANKFLHEAKEKNAELKKQVDERENEIDRLEKVVYDQAEQYWDCKEKAVKDTAKEIAKYLLINDEFGDCSYAVELIKQRYGVEVE